MEVNNVYFHFPKLQSEMLYLGNCIYHDPTTDRQRVPHLSLGRSREGNSDVKTKQYLN